MLMSWDLTGMTIIPRHPQMLQKFRFFVKFKIFLWDNWQTKNCKINHQRSLSYFQNTSKWTITNFAEFDYCHNYSKTSQDVTKVKISSKIQNFIWDN